MARLPTFKRFSREDFKGAGSWIDKLIEPLNEFMNSIVSALNSSLTFQANMNCEVRSFQVQTLTELLPGEGFIVGEAKTFVDADVNVGTDTISITAHGFATGDSVRLTTSGTLPAPLAIDTDYFIIRTNANSFQLAASLSEAFAGTNITITSAAGGGTHTIDTFANLPGTPQLREKVAFTLEKNIVPLGLVKLSILDRSGRFLVQAADITWTYQNGIIQIENISGLRPGTRYDVTVLVVGRQ